MSLRTKIKRLQVELDSLRNQAIEDDIVFNDSMLDGSSDNNKEENIVE